MTKSLTLLLLLATPATALAGHGAHGSSDQESPHESARDKSERGHRSGGSGFKMHELVFRMIAEKGEELGIDEKTQKKIRTLVDSHRERMDELHAEMKAAYSELNDLMEATQTDLDETLAQADEVATLKGEVFKQQIRTMVELKQHLTEEQIEEIHEIVKRKMHKKKKHRGWEHSPHDKDRAEGEDD
jgi:Spy/CpxP family protein refolding chaperone